MPRHFCCAAPGSYEYDDDRAATRIAPHHPKQAFAPSAWPHSALGTTRSPGARARVRSAHAGRFLSARPQLATIHEEPEDEDRGGAFGGAPLGPLSYLDVLPQTDAAEAGPSHHQDRDVEMAWDEESTLVAMLQDM